MRVKSHQIRAKVAFTKPLTTHLMHGKGDFLCRGTSCHVKIKTKITNGNMYAVHVVKRPLTMNYKQLLDEVFVMIRISKGKENVIGFS